MISSVVKNTLANQSKSKKWELNITTLSELWYLNETKTVEIAELVYKNEWISATESNKKNIVICQITS